MFLVRSQTSHMAYISTMRESPEALVEKSYLKCTQIQKTEPRTAAHLLSGNCAASCKCVL